MVMGVNRGSLPEIEDSSGELADQPVLPVACWLPSVYQTLVFGSERFLIRELAEFSAATGSSF